MTNFAAMSSFALDLLANAKLLIFFIRYCEYSPLTVLSFHMKAEQNISTLALRSPYSAVSAKFFENAKGNGLL